MADWAEQGIPSTSRLFYRIIGRFVLRNRFVTISKVEHEYAHDRLAEGTGIT